MPKHGLSVRSDSVCCPLALSLDSYWTCGFNCVYCYCREMNRTWGHEPRPLDPAALRRKLLNGLANRHPKTALAWALKQKKTIRFGSKGDPFAPEDDKFHVTVEVLKILQELSWSVKIETKSDLFCLHPFIDYLDNDRVVITVTITVGGFKDWELLEGKRTPPPDERLKALQGMAAKGFQCGIIMEPFIPGYHTPQQFEDLVESAAGRGITRFNVFNLHLTPFVAQRLNEVPDLDIERVFLMNQDENWRAILRDIIAICDRHSVILGCPDFINARDHPEQANTCCGVDVPNPTTFNYPTWKHILEQTGQFTREDMERSHDGIGARKSMCSLLFSLPYRGRKRGEKDVDALFYDGEALGWRRKSATTFVKALKPSGVEPLL